MLCDDVLLDIVEFEVPFGVALCSSGMCESVNNICKADVVPVVEEIIVKERASYKAVLVDFDLEGPFEEVRDQETELCDCEAVLENRCLPVLYKLLCCLSFRT